MTKKLEIINSLKPILELMEKTGHRTFKAKAKLPSERNYRTLTITLK